MINLRTTPNQRRSWRQSAMRNPEKPISRALVALLDDVEQLLRERGKQADVIANLVDEDPMPQNRTWR